MSNTTKMAFGGVLGALYILLGLFQIFTAVAGQNSAAEYLLLSGDPFSGFVMIVVGAVLASGAWKIYKGIGDGVVFIYVGMALSVIFGLIVLLSLCAGAIEILAFGEEGDAWGLANAVLPLLYLGVIGFAGFLAWGREFIGGITKT